MAIPGKKLRALVTETKKERKFASSADAEDEGQDSADEGDDEDTDDEDEDEREADTEEEKGPTPEQVQAAVDAVDDGGDDQIMDLVADFDDDGSVPDFVADEGKWNKAKAAVKPREDDLEEPLAVIAHVYKSMGGQFDTGGGEGGEDEGTEE